MDQRFWKGWISWHMPSDCCPSDAFVRSKLLPADVCTQMAQCVVAPDLKRQSVFFLQVMRSN